MAIYDGKILVGKYKESENQMTCHDNIKNKKNIAIIMATYNGEKYISEQIESILDNTYKDFVIHICDDGSTDTTLIIAERYKKLYPENIEIHRNEDNLRVVRNMLHWTSCIDANYYMFSDQDDFWNRDKIEKSFAYIKEIEQSNRNKPVVIFSDAEVVDERLNILHDSFQKHEMLSSYKVDLKNLLMENKLLGCSVMFNKATQEILSESQEIQSDIRMHDWWVGLIGAAFGKVAYLDEPLLKYRQHSNNEVGSLGAIGYILKNIFHLRKQRQLLYALFKQGGIFLSTYSELLSDEQKKYLDMFSTFYTKHWFYRHYVLIRNGYRKTGIIRNIGMFFIL